MKRAGQIALLRFPQADLAPGKLRPALLLAGLPGDYDDWLICMVSSQLRHCTAHFDEIVQESDADFMTSGLRVASVIRIGRLAVVEGKLLLGTTGAIAEERLQRIQGHLAAWISRGGDRTTSSA